MCDNLGAVQIGNDSASLGKTKALDVRLHNMKELIQYGELKLIYVNTHLNLSDILTKNLPAPTFAKHKHSVLGTYYGDELLLDGIQDVVVHKKRPTNEIPNE